MLLISLPSSTFADARSDYLVRLLRTSDAFRVRAQAALTLGSVQAEPAVLRALEAALRDPDASVRAASAQSLERLGDPSSVGPLRSASADSVRAVRDAVEHAVRALESRAGARLASASRTSVAAPSVGSSVPSAGARYYVGIGAPGASAGVDRAVLSSARTFLANQVSAIDGVALAPESETPRQATAVLRQRSLVGVYLDSSIVSLEQRPDGAVRAQVSIVVQSYPDHNVRSMLSGAATVMGESGPAAQRAAIEHAMSSALRNLGTALAAAGPR